MRPSSTYNSPHVSRLPASMQVAPLCGSSIICAINRGFSMGKISGMHFADSAPRPWLSRCALRVIESEWCPGSVKMAHAHAVNPADGGQSRQGWSHTLGFELAEQCRGEPGLCREPCKRQPLLGAEGAQLHPNAIGLEGPLCVGSRFGHDNLLAMSLTPGSPPIPDEFWKLLGVWSQSGWIMNARRERPGKRQTASQRLQRIPRQRASKRIIGS